MPMKVGFARLRMPSLDLEFVTGREIVELDVELGEDARVSNCQVQLLFKDLTVPALLIERSLARGGIAIPNDLLGAAQTVAAAASSDAASAPTASPIPGGGTSGTSANGVPLSDAPEGTQGDELAKYIVQYCQAVGVTDKSHQAYILATAEHESVMGVYTAEIGGESATYAPWYGRGLVQITWESNYKKFEEWIGDDFTSGEEARNRVSSLKYAIPILVCGMTGAQNSPNFTGVVLSDYGEGSSFDAVGARATVNGTDKASLIAGYYDTWLTKIDTLYNYLAPYGAIDGSAYNVLDLVQSAAKGIVSIVDRVRPTARSGGDVARSIAGIANQTSGIVAGRVNERSVAETIAAPAPTPAPPPGRPDLIDGIGGGLIPPTDGGSPSPSPSPDPATPSPSPSPTPDPSATPTPAPAPTPTPTPNYAGTEMEITLGLWGEEADARLYQFIYTRIDGSLIPPYRFTLSGRSVRWNISQGRLPSGEAPPLGRVGGVIVESPTGEDGAGAEPNPDDPTVDAAPLTVLENVTLDEAASQVAFHYGLRAIVHPNARNFRYPYIKFDRKNPLKTLAKLASDAGFYLTDNSLPRSYAPGDPVPSIPGIGQGLGQSPSPIVGGNQNGKGDLIVDRDTDEPVVPGNIDGGSNGDAPTPSDEEAETPTTSTASDRLVPQITFRIGYGQVTRLSIVDEASNDRIVTGDLGEAVTVGQSTEGAEIDPETGEPVPPNGVVEGIDGEDTLPGTNVAESLIQVAQGDGLAIRRAAEIGGGGIVGESDFVAAVLGSTGFAPGDPVQEIADQVNVGEIIATGGQPTTPDGGSTGDPTDPNAPTEEGTPTPTANTSAPLPTVDTIPDHTSIGRGYPTQTRILASSVTLALKPGDFVQLEDSLVPPPFNRKWRIERVRHTLGQDGFWSELFFYLPVKIRRSGGTTTSTGTGTTTGGGTTGGTPQGTVGGIEELENMPSISFVTPDPLGEVTSPMGPRTAPTAGASSNHRGTDIASGMNPLYAVAAGKVVNVGGVDGYGEYVITIDHGSVAGQDGQTWYIATMYGHCDSSSVQAGDIVQQNQEIAIAGTRGVSTGVHLHINCYASPSWRVSESSYYPSDVTVFVDIMENFINKTFVGDGNLKGHRFTS